jgi:DNA polymerase-3 subunit alpha
MNFVPLNIKTGYTFLKSGIRIKDLIARSKELGYDAIAIADFGVLYGFPELDKYAQKSGIKPFFGAKFRVGDFAIALYVKSEEGYANLCFLSTHFESGKEIDVNILKAHSKGLISVVDTLGSPAFMTIDQELFEVKLSTIGSLFDDFYIGLNGNTYEEVAKFKLIEEFSKSYSFSTIAFPSVSYVKKDDAIVLKLLESIEKQASFNPKEFTPDKEEHLKSIEELKRVYSDEEIEKTSDLVSTIDFQFAKKRGKLLRFSKDEDSSQLLKEKILEGLKKRGILLEDDERYRDRLNYEFLTIVKMGYADYFLIVQDYVNYAKSVEITTGPGRGSAAGSLVSYLLGITEVDPLKYNLLFERFLNPQRKSMPDIDIDFSDLRRNEIFSYIKNRYGKERCARVIAYQTFGTKQSLRDVTKAIGYPNKIADEICKTIPNYNTVNYNLDSAYQNFKAFRDKIESTPDFETIYQYAKLIEELPRQKGLHAAGIIIDDNPLIEEIPLTYEEDGEAVTQYEKDFLEDQGFLKMDILGLTNLSTIERCLTIIAKTTGKTIAPKDIPYDTREIFPLIEKGRTMGLFQLDTSAALNAISYIKPNCFEDIVATISLDRPGPMQQIPSYSRRKHGLEKVTYPDKSLIPYLKDTYGIMIYQEQIMQICRGFAGFTFAEADTFRRAISKKNKAELEAQRANFYAGAKKMGHDDKTIGTIFDLILKFASYGFNKSHAVCYAIIACQEAYLKANFPAQFYMAILDQQYGSNDIKFNKYANEIRQSGVEIELPSVNKSTLNFELDGKKLLMPLIGINNLPRKVVYNILDERDRNGPYNSFIDFVIRLSQGDDKITENQLQKLIDAGCFDELTSNRKSLKLSTPSALQFATSTVYKQGELFNNYGLKFELINTEDDPKERIEYELEAVGIMLSDNPLNHIPPSVLEGKRLISIDQIEKGKYADCIGIIRSIKTTQVKHGKDAGKPMAFVTIYDESGEVDCVLFPSDYAKYGPTIKANDLVMVSGKVDERNQSLNLNVFKMERIE